jgi:HUS1 checkpoint protein
VSIQLPGLKLVRTVAERMKSLSPYIVLLANHEGTLIFKVETPEATVSTHFKNLLMENSGGL